jgi:hypothetical protein
MLLFSASRLQRRLPIVGSLLMLLVGQTLGLAEADAGELFRRFTVWGRFRPGSWVVVRQATDNLDPTGQVVSSSSTETRTTLAGVDERFLTLKVQASLEVGGKTLEGPPQEVRQGPNGERPEAPVVLAVVGEEDVRIQDQVFRCQIRQSEHQLAGKRTVTRIWTSPEVDPFELRRKTTIIDAATGRTTDETIVEVVSLPLQRRILARFRPAAEVSIVHRHDRGSTSARGYCCPDVPGGVVSQSSEDYDAAGRLLRRTRTELIDFETK